MRAALAQLAEWEDDPALADQDPLSPLSFSCVTDEVRKSQDELYAIYQEGMHIAFSPLAPDGRPLRKCVSSPFLLLTSSSLRVLAWGRTTDPKQSQLQVLRAEGRALAELERGRLFLHEYYPFPSLLPLSPSSPPGHSRHQAVPGPHQREQPRQAPPGQTPQHLQRQRLLLAWERQRQRRGRERAPAGERAGDVAAVLALGAGHAGAAAGRAHPARDGHPARHRGQACHQGLDGEGHRVWGGHEPPASTSALASVRPGSDFSSTHFWLPSLSIYSPPTRPVHILLLYILTSPLTSLSWLFAASYTHRAGQAASSRPLLLGILLPVTHISPFSLRSILRRSCTIRTLAHPLVHSPPYLLLCLLSRITYVDKSTY